MSLINREDLIAEYDRVHIGPPGGARKLMVDALEVQPEPKWIPCSERLPQIGIDVLLTVKDSGHKWVAEGCRRVDDRWWHYFMNRDLEHDKVTAWMPLPKSYEVC